MMQRSGLRWWHELDAILRRSSDGETCIEQSLWRLLLAAACSGGLYGSFVGWFAIKSFGWPGWMQIVAAAVKIPLLFMLTLAVTFPSLYLFSALLDAPLGFRQTLRLLMTAILVTLAAAASFGPILGFFTLSTESYAFMLLLNVALLGTAGVIGMAFLMVRMRTAESEVSAQEQEATEHRAEVAETSTEPKTAERSTDEPPPSVPPRVATWSRTQTHSALRGLPPTIHRGSGLLQLWILIYGLVGVQMAWILRPFVGNPEGELAFFRPVGGNFFEGLFRAIERLLGV